MDGRQGQLRSAAASSRNRVSGKLGQIWWWFMLRGIAAGILGLCAIFWPSATIGVLVTLVGIFCLLDGAASLAGMFRISDRGPGMVQALISLAVGLILLFWPGATIRTLLVMFGVWLLVTGISQILAARRDALEREDGNYIMSIGGGVAAIGLVLIVWPGTGVVAISWLIAIAALAVSALLIFLARRLKRIKDRMDAPA